MKHSISVLVVGNHLSATYELLYLCAVSSLFKEIVFVSSITSSTINVPEVPGVKYLQTRQSSLPEDLGEKAANLLNFCSNTLCGLSFISSDLVLRLRSDLTLDNSSLLFLVNAILTNPNKVSVLDYHPLLEPFVTCDFIHGCKVSLLKSSMTTLLNKRERFSLLFSCKAILYPYFRTYFCINETVINLALVRCSYPGLQSSLNFSSFSQWRFYRSALFLLLPVPRGLSIPSRLLLRRRYNIKRFFYSRLSFVANTLLFFQ